MTTDPTVTDERRSDALLVLRGAAHLPFGRDRTAHGSITAAAKALGYSYKAVWDRLNAINNLMPRPALLTQSGGRGGGGTRGVRCGGSAHRTVGRDIPETIDMDQGVELLGPGPIARGVGQ